MKVDVEKGTRGLILLINVVVIIGGLNILATGRNANILFMGLLSLFYTFFIMRRIRIVSPLQILWVIWFLFMCWNCLISYTRGISVKYLAVNFMPLLFMLFLEIHCIDCGKILKFVRVFCVIYACSIILALFMKESISDFYGSLMAGGDSAGAAARIREEMAIGSYSGLTGEKGYAALYMNIGIGIELAEHCRKKRLSKENVCLLLLYFIALLLASKRTFFMIAIVQCGLALCLFEDIKNKAKNMFAGLVLGIPCLLIAFVTIPQLTNLFERFKDGMEDPTMMGRTAFWGFCLEMFRLKPKFGFGFGSFNDVYFDMTQYLYKGQPWEYHAHNIYLQLLGETGIVGFLLFLIPAAGCLILSVLLFRSIKESGVMRQIAYMGMYLQFLFLAYGITGNFIYENAESAAYFTGILFTFTALRQKIRMESGEEESGFEENRNLNFSSGG